MSDIAGETPGVDSVSNAVPAALLTGISQSHNSDIPAITASKPDGGHGSNAEISNTLLSRILELPLLVSVGEFNYEDFKNRWGDQDRYHVIELLMGSERTVSEVNREKMRRSKAQGFRTQRQEIALKVSVGDSWIQRIRIHSPILLRILRIAMDVHDWNTEQPRVFFRPFKCIVYYHDRIKHLLRYLENKLSQTESLDTQSRNQGTSPSISEIGSTVQDHCFENEDIPELNDPSMTAAIAIEHLRCYVEFMDTRVLSMQAPLNGNDTARVRFEDLWSIFQVGEIIYAPTIGSTYDAGDPCKRYQTAFRLFHKSDAVIRDDEPNDLQIKTVPGQGEDWSPVNDRPKPLGFPHGVPGGVPPSAPPPTEKQEGFRRLTLWCYYIDYNGMSYGPVRHKFYFDAFSGRKDIRTLVAYPMRFAVDHERLKADLNLQGEKFKTFADKKHVFCEGWTVKVPPLGRPDDDLWSQRKSSPTHIESDVIIDVAEALRKKVDWRMHFGLPSAGETTSTWLDGSDNTKLLHWFNFDEKDKSKAKKPLFEIVEVTQRSDDAEEKVKQAGIDADKFLKAWQKGPVRNLVGLDEDINTLLLPRRLSVYVLRLRKFRMVDVFSLRMMPCQTDIFDELKIDANHKLILQSLVSDHFEKRRLQRRAPNRSLISQDIIRGKGSGLFILLHGVPGVGKTATAEAVAQANSKPLFTIACGDLGLDPENVEERLMDIFRLAHIWDCVLLLDEADIFLARRDNFNLQRNALVSVFLRVLEYYSGILFLTTNRVGLLDEAFKSRIHISLYYEPLSRDQTVDIFRFNIQRLRDIEKERQFRSQDSAEERPKLLIKAKKIVYYAKQYFDNQEDTPHLRWNGRQIRNAFQIATSLAQFKAFQSHEVASMREGSEGFVLDETQFVTVAEAIEKFGNYMDYTRAKTDSDEARLDSIRADDITNEKLASMNRGYNTFSPASTQRHGRRFQQDRGSTQSQKGVGRGTESTAGRLGSYHRRQSQGRGIGGSAAQAFRDQPFEMAHESELFEEEDYDDGDEGPEWQAQQTGLEDEDYDDD
ncbi:hypothetical protein CGCF415_v014929 [Colletotrichum fructicola]|nr:hypothetical protein CGCF415_v014929 [Colletotrichum fructicola]